MNNFIKKSGVETPTPLFKHELTLLITEQSIFV